MSRAEAKERIAKEIEVKKGMLVDTREGRKRLRVSAHWRRPSLEDFINSLLEKGVAVPVFEPSLPEEE
ncbi:hypothetical protein COV04_02165 [Candidatus Uhrbacteria bacterium CG10_big_fil_rev_8_21_14_0_10_48_11]|uniref:Uncharacterized protein n=1 Tax=Candidatus Uhrbacteria bacterium CG10_big_fil_rev_8_21_14_0_10_48_11 TaxID=1975037 RepID=A0A2M8LER1_9BACT|nr:MAG: hypothetical protein COV04_02165 [Candidatus Uhrbacteria bacterium CG10_big_fil_rev_8_21_14_0_10_48_11]